jgi:hypothetical protein
LEITFSPSKGPIEEVAMTTVRSFSPRDPTQTDLIRYFDRNLVTADPLRTIDHFAVDARARQLRAAMVDDMIGQGIAWLRRHMRHLGETRSPAPGYHVESRVQF